MLVRTKTRFAGNAKVYERRGGHTPYVQLPLANGGNISLEAAEAIAMYQTLGVALRDLLKLMSGPDPVAHPAIAHVRETAEVSA